MKRSLSRARKRGHITRRDAAAAESLSVHGLRPSQVMIGTGLLTPQEAQLYDVRHESLGDKIQPQQASRILYNILRDADRVGAHQIRILPTDREADVLFENGGERRVPSSVLPALSLRAQRVAPRRGWHVEILPAGIGPSLHFIRRRSESEKRHPADWSVVFKDFRKQPTGLMVIILPDAYVSRHFIAKYSLGSSIDDWRNQEVSGPLLYDADQADTRELALHAALSGKTAIACMSMCQDDWWLPAHQAGIPVRVLRGRLTEGGPAWEAFAL